MNNEFSLAKKFKQEIKRQKNTLNLIASENYPSKKILFYAGSFLTSKYSEGYPDNRYYQGCQLIDEIENLAIELVKKLFRANYANVQPHSGSQANQAVYLALLNSGDRILSLDLAAGGHLSHGSKVNYSGQIYQIKHYELDPTTQRLDYKKIEQIAQEFKPHLIVAGYSSYSLQIDFAKFREIADQVGAYLLADIAHVAGLVATGLFLFNPVHHAHVVTFTTHKSLRGPRGAVILSQEKEISKKINKAVFPGLQGGPNQAIIAAKAQCFYEALQPSFKEYQQKALENAKVMADYFISRGAKVVSGGTETHLLLVDTIKSYDRMTGKEAAEILEKVGIICNKNVIPYDEQKPQITSGIRLGSPALTTRGLGKKEFLQIAEIIHKVLRNYKDSKLRKKTKKQIQNWISKFPLRS